MEQVQCKKLLEAAANAKEARVFLTAHVKKRMRERGVTLTQIKRVLANGIITEGPYQEASGNWKVNINALDAGQDITVVVALTEDSEGASVVIVTLWDGNKGW